MRPTCLDLRDLSIFLLEIRAASAQDVASLNCLDRVSSFLFLFLSSSFIFFFILRKKRDIGGYSKWKLYDRIIGSFEIYFVSSGIYVTSSFGI